MPDGKFYGAVLWYHLMAPFYGMCVPGFRIREDFSSSVAIAVEFRERPPSTVAIFVQL